MTSKTAVLANVTLALANETALEQNGQCLKGIAAQIGYAGIKVTSDELVAALNAVSETCPSCFGPMPPLSTHYGPWGLEYRLRPTPEVRDATRACVDAVYTVTDTMDRTPKPVTCKNNRGNLETIEIETVRPRAFATALGHLRLRWAAGNFTTPRPSTIRRWVGIA